MNLTRAGFFGAIGAALFGAKAAPVVSRLAVVPVPRKYTMTTMVAPITADQISSRTITNTIITVNGNPRQIGEEIAHIIRQHGIYL